MTSSEKKSGLALSITGPHSMMCPVHGVIPNTMYLLGGSSATLTQYKVFKPFLWVHEKEVEGMSYILNKINPQEHTHTTKQHEHHHHHENIHPYAEPSTALLNYALAGMSLYYFVKSKIKKYRGKNK